MKAKQVYGQIDLLIKKGESRERDSSNIVCDVSTQTELQIRVTSLHKTGSRKLTDPNGLRVMRPKWARVAGATVGCKILSAE